MLGRKLEAVVVDPASNWPLFAEKARELITKDKVSAVFGCWTSVSRKSVLPVFEELNSLLFYPVQYEGEESERNVFYTGAAPNQQAIPAVDYLAKEEKVQRWVLAGTDYVYPRTTNKILEAYLLSKGVAPADISINYTPFGHSDWQTRVAATVSGTGRDVQLNARLYDVLPDGTQVLVGARDRAAHEAILSALDTANRDHPDSFTTAVVAETLSMSIDVVMRSSCDGRSGRTR